MPVISHETDTTDHSITITADFNAPLQRVWDVYADPRTLEQIWGPPTHPATFTQHELAPGGRMDYHMTGPDGEEYHGYWLIDEVDEHERIAFRDGFADATGAANPDLPLARNEFLFSEQDGHTTVRYITHYSSEQELNQSIEMGAIDGATLAINQIDEHVAAPHD